MELFVGTCPVCIGKAPRKPSSAGHKPIITEGFGTRGQVDLIDMQANKDGKFAYLLNYQDHGIKFYDNRALESKRNAAIAFALLEVTHEVTHEIVRDHTGDRVRSYGMIARYYMGDRVRSYGMIARDYMGDRVR